MKYSIFVFLCALFSISAVSAQNTKTYTGFVVDKNGSPLVGAEIMAPGGGASAISDSDGSFSIEVPITLNKLTSYYTGMGEKTLKLGNNSSNLIFKMKHLKKMTGFISVIGNVGVSINKYSGYEWSLNRYEAYTYTGTGACLGGGLMGGQIGQLGKWGWYVKGIGYADEEDEVGALALTAGAIRKLGSKTHLYFGAGGAVSNYRWGFAIDLGTIINVSDHINLIAGLNYVNCIDGGGSYKYNNINLNIGVGYTF